MTFKKKMSVIAALICTLLLTTQAFSQAVPLNIAVVDFNAVLVKAAAPKNIRDQVTAIRAKYRNEVQKQETGLRTANQELAKKQSLLSPDAFKEERRKFEQKVLEVQKSVQQKNLNLQNAQNDAQNKVKQALRDIVLKISKDKGYTLVLRREQTIVVADQMDITAEVIAALDKALPSIKVSTGK